MGVKVCKLQCPCEKFELRFKLPIFFPRGRDSIFENVYFHSKIVFLIFQLLCLCPSWRKFAPQKVTMCSQIFKHPTSCESLHCERNEKVKMEGTTICKIRYSPFLLFVKKCDQICNIYKHLEENPLTTFSSIIDWTSIVCQKKRKIFS